ncbi:MAG: TonB-dependent receptor [Pseudomonadota bacterium]
MSERYDVQVLAASDVLRGRMSPEVAGDLSADQALKLVLAGQNLMFKRASNGGFVILPKGAVRRSPPTLRALAAAQTMEVSDTIVVTGTKLGLSPQETADSGEIFVTARLEREVLTNLIDALARTPGVSALPGDVGSVTIRGISRNGLAGQSDAINVFVDGAPSSNAALAGTQSLWDVRQVEVLRGSQSTVQGRNAIAGSILVESQDPTLDWESRMRVGFNDQGMQQIAGVVSGPLIRDELAFRISADYQEDDGYIKNAVTRDDDATARETLLVRNKWLWLPGAWSRFSGLLTLEYAQRNLGFGYLLVAPVSADSPTFSEFDPRGDKTFPTTEFHSDRETFRAIADVEYQLNDAMLLKSVFTHETANLDNVVLDLESSSPYGRIGSSLAGQVTTETAEVRFGFEWPRWSGVMGAYYLKETADNRNRVTAVVGNVTPFPTTPPDSVISSRGMETAVSKNHALFTAWRFKPNDKWTLQVGLRYDDEQFEIRQRVLQFDVMPQTCSVRVPGFLLGQPTTVEMGCEAGATRLLPSAQPLQAEGYAAWLPRATVFYHWSDDLSLFSGARRGYRGGGVFQALSQTSTDVFRPSAYDPEFLTSYEAGWRGQWLAQTLTLNGTFYLSDYEDQQVSFVDADGFRTIANAAESSIRGFELALGYQLGTAWQFNASLGVLKAEIDQWLFVANGETFDLSGNQLARSPRLSYNVSVAYEGSNGFFADVGLHYQGSSESDFFNLGRSDLQGLSERIESVAMVNARAGYKSGRYTWTLTGTNLLDEDSPSSINIADAGVLSGVGGFFDRPVFRGRPPRSIGLVFDISL